MKYLPLLLATVLLSGCFTRTVFIHSEVPVYDLPPRPMLDTSLPDNSNEQQLRTYATQLELIINRHNEWAVKNNTPVVGR